MKYVDFKNHVQATLTENDNEVHINLIVVESGFENRGYGTQYMQNLIVYCKRYKKRLTLIPSDLFGSKMRRLKKWYKRLGFKPYINYQWIYCN